MTKGKKVMTLEERINYVLENYPDPMTQAQLANAIGLGESSTYKLIRDGIIPYYNEIVWPCHYHMIRRKDVIEYLKVRYAHASEGYIEAGRHCIALMLWDAPEILTITDVSRIAGVSKNAAQKWINAKKIRGFYYLHTVIVRKKDLIEFMSTPSYQDSSHKNLYAEAITMFVEWYYKVTEAFRKGGFGHED